MKKNYILFFLSMLCFSAKAQMVCDSEPRTAYDGGYDLTIHSLQIQSTWCGNVSTDRLFVWGNEIGDVKTIAPLRNHFSVTNTGSGSATYNSSTGVFNIPTPTAGAVFLPNTTVAQTAVLALLGGVRKLTITGVTGIVAGDRVILTPTGSTPIGYALADVVATAANTLEVSFTAPALALGASFSIPCKVTVFR